MKARSYCGNCLKDLARQVVTLSGGDESLLSSSLRLVDSLFGPGLAPTDVSNSLLNYIREESGIDDPFADRKGAEFRRALDAAAKLNGFFPDTLEGALMSSAFGNGGDFFMEHRYDTKHFEFHGDVAKIGGAVYISRKILILGDNPGDFVFDIPLVRLLETMGKQVFYALKAGPVQNDMSMTDLAPLGAENIYEDVISTGTRSVGIKKEEMSGTVLECWEDESLVIAKGMGNYETISEFDRERPVVYIMNVKCSSVAEALGRGVGEYIAIAGGEHG